MEQFQKIKVSNPIVEMDGNIAFFFFQFISLNCVFQIPIRSKFQALIGIIIETSCSMQNVERLLVEQPILVKFKLFFVVLMCECSAFKDYD